MILPYDAWGRDSEENTVKKFIIVICSVLVLALVVGCSADSIMRTGKAMGKLGDASLGGVGVKLADDAAKSVDDFTEKLEALLSFDGVSRTGEGADEKIEGVVMLNGGGFSDEFSALMKDVVDKILEGGNSNIILTERGASFGYNNLVVDMRSFPIMRSFGYPVVFDATHSVQLPGGSGTSSSGNRELAEYLARAAVGAGVDGLFMEVHDNPEEALCDGPNSIYLDKLEDILKDCLSIYNIVRKKLY